MAAFAIGLATTPSALGTTPNQIAGNAIVIVVFAIWIASAAEALAFVAI